MLSTVEFNHQLCFDACEIDYVAADWMLSLELVPAKPAPPYDPPELSLHVGGLASHASRVTTLRLTRLSLGSGIGSDHYAPSP
jgi:hypothetical protein